MVDAIIIGVGLLGCGLVELKTKRDRGWTIIGLAESELGGRSTSD